MSLRPRRPASPLLAFLALVVTGCVTLLLWAALAPEEGTDNRALVEQQGLTDPALFTEARYTRHLSLSDYHAPFQDHPGALEHFPSGALTVPPPTLVHAPLAR